MTSSPDSAAPPEPSLWRHRNFRTFLIGQSANVTGSSISSMVIPVIAVLELHATTSQVAWLAFLGLLPPALLALHAGALADRHSKKRQMIIGDLVSAAALTTVPVAAALDVLTLSQLMAVAAVQGAAGVVHDAAAISILPSLVDRSLIQRSNSRVGTLFAIAATAGSHLGAALTALVGPARALLGDVLSYLVSAWCTARVHTPEADRVQAGERRLWAEIGDGLRYVREDERLRTLTLVNATTSLALALLNTLWALYLLRTLAMSTTAFGVVLGLGALGAATGALLAPALARRFGPGPMMLAALAITPVTQVPLLLASPGLGWEIVIGSALFVQLVCAGAAGTTQRSIRQIITDSGMQARMQAVSTWLTAGARPVGALLAGALGTWAGVRSALFIGACLLIVPLLVLALSPLRGLRQMPEASRAPKEPAPAEELPRAGPPRQVPALGTAPAADIHTKSSSDGGAP
ncbi:MFS transporter (plasmid) [Streptomyces sp. BB1-1-1]|uniref:MFS transporter n=1 Tax=Streptomyces sp. BB1-1-1 TaxID=3074430 RepID=UPI002877691F|nr:MFS transporter [Streptomyces sp. BB1-1-1]WND40743.1 MFS transporter [Streptomyces sp. BB1-1-1]